MSHTLLLVDDNVELRSSMAERLRASSFHVVEAADGEQALSLHRETGAVDLVVTDLDMPHRDGLSLIEELRCRQPGLPALLVSTHPPGGHLMQGPNAITWLRKPFSGNHLLQLVSELTTADKEPLAAPASGNGRSHQPTHRSSARSRHWARSWKLAVLAVVLTATSTLVAILFSQSPLPAPTGGAQRGVQEIVVETPVGPLTRPPSRLAWHPVPGATSYEVELRGVDDRLLWHAHTTTPWAHPPRRDLFAAGVVYFWRVAALDSAGRAVASSGRVRFRLSPSSED